MKLKKIIIKYKELLLKLILVALIMLICMTAYEILKQIISPNITIWQSHIVTIIFSAICATIAAYFVLKSHFKLTNTLIEENIKSKRLQKELVHTVEQLQTSLSEVKTLTGLLPICASCKRIRDDKGYWNQIESYIKEHSEIDFTHGLCPECAKKLYPEIYTDLYEKNKDYDE